MYLPYLPVLNIEFILKNISLLSKAKGDYHVLFINCEYGQL